MFPYRYAKQQLACALSCSKTVGCLCFFYNEGSSTCRLHSYLFRATELQPSAGDVYFRPLCPSFPVSPVPYSTIHTSTVNGSETANVVCNDGYKLTNDPGAVLCDDDGFWPTITGTCEQTHWTNQIAPFTVTVPGNMYEGASINFTARLTGSIYTFNMYYGNNDVALQMRALSSGKVMWYKRQSGAWENVGSDTTRTPFTPINTTTTCLVETRVDKIQVSVDGSEYFSMAYFQDVTEINKVSFLTSVDILEVDLLV
ncbi:uncharacterized protein LOC124148094 [Haliotis rufescens]|uniref:uncharacterized protein LOC124148094 n=1 Tax=Haliotis rufescens TaxID=6454 RepID=UPI00201E90F1|nr:uncharacterized protein LOC124148094 [Haliotis rufescens]